MAKDVITFRIEDELKEKIREDLSDFYTNEQILIAGYEALTIDKESFVIKDQKLREAINSLVSGGELSEEDIMKIGYKTISNSKVFRQSKEENEIIELVRNMNLTKLKILNLLSQEAIKEDPKFQKALEEDIEESKIYFHIKNLNLDFFDKQFDSNDNNFIYKLSRISTWTPFSTLVKMASGDWYFVVETDSQFDRVSFGIVGKGKGVTIPLKEVINNNGRIKEVYKLKDLSTCNTLKKEIAARKKLTKKGK